MITEALIDFALGLVTFVLELLPADTVEWPELDGWASWLGGVAGPFNTLAPLEEMAVALDWSVTLIFPVLLVARLSLFIWFLLPGT